MFQFLKEIKQAICEGVAEAREELRQEEEERKKEEANRAAERERIYSEPLSLEKLALAFSCPMREILIPGDSIRLFQFFALSEGDQKVAGKMLKRDFEIQDRESLARSVLEFQELDEKSVFICSILLYQITAAVDRKDLISDTIIPWVADWLLYYELWLATGEWLGGGHGSPSVNNSH